MRGLTNYFVVFVGAGLGGAMRHTTNMLSAKFFGPGFPVGTIIVNIAGSFAIGILSSYFVLRERAHDTTWFFVATGVLGGFTTFSAFSLDAGTMWNRGEGIVAAFYVVASVALSLTAVFMGLKFGARTF